ncbi:IL8 protein, partial [Anhinga anhinga]|nr:IL8 protein [Anhinga anhinga]
QIIRLFIYLDITYFGSAGKALATAEHKGFRCLCIRTHSKFIPPKAIRNVRLSQSGPRCKNGEIVATLKGGRRVCLEPTAPWVQLTVKSILAR